MELNAPFPDSKKGREREQGAALLQFLPPQGGLRGGNGPINRREKSKILMLRITERKSHPSLPGGILMKYTVVSFSGHAKVFKLVGGSLRLRLEHVHERTRSSGTGGSNPPQARKLSWNSAVILWVRSTIAFLSSLKSFS